MPKLWWSLVLLLAWVHCLPGQPVLGKNDTLIINAAPGSVLLEEDDVTPGLSTTDSSPATGPTSPPGSTLPPETGKQTNAEFVNLIHPTFIGVKILNDESVSSAGAAIELQTRAGKYKLIDYDVSANAGGRIQRQPGNAWTEPSNSSLLEQSSFIENEMSPVSKEEITKRATVNSVDIRFKQDEKATPFWIHMPASCMVNVKGTPFKLILRDNSLQICDTKENYCQIIRFLYKFNNLPTWYQFYSIEAVFDGKDKLTLLAFDSIGRVIRSNWRLDFKDKTFKVFSYDDTMVANTLSAIDVDSKPFISAEKVSEEVDEFFKKDFDRRQRANFVEAISPIYGPSLPVLRQQANDTNNNATDVTPPTTGNLGLCVVNGYRLPNNYDYVNPTVPLLCRSKDKSIKSMIPSFDSKQDVIIYALHITNYQDKSYYHFFLSLVTQNGTDITQHDYLYKYITHNETIAEGKDLSKNKYVLDDLQPQGSETSRVVITVPNDIVGYYKKQNDSNYCQRAIILYDMIYSVHEPNTEMTWPDNDVKRSDDLYFYITAAMSVGDQFYFFTHTNKMVVMRGDIPNCGKDLVFSDKREEYSQDFLMLNLFGVSDSWPYLLDYRELVNDNNVRPKGDCPNLKANSGDSSAIIIIIIGLIIGGLILAGLLYVFCLRGSDHDFNGPAGKTPSSKNSRKSKIGGPSSSNVPSAKSGKSKSFKRAKTPERDPNHSLHSLTVRSGVTSASGSKPSSPIKSSSPMSLKASPSAAASKTGMNQKSSRVVSSPASKIGASRSRAGASSPSKMSATDKSKRHSSPHTKLASSPSKMANSRASSKASSRTASPVAKSRSTPSSKRSSPSSPKNSRKSSPVGKR